MRPRVSPTVATTIVHSPLWVCFLLSRPCPISLPLCQSFSTGFIALFDCFFNSVVVGVPCGLIFWHFWLFIDFRLVVQQSEGFLCMPPSWPELLTLWWLYFYVAKMIFSLAFNIMFEKAFPIIIIRKCCPPLLYVLKEKFLSAFTTKKYNFSYELTLFYRYQNQKVSLYNKKA